MNKYRRIKENEEKSDEKFHPYYKFLGYDKLEQVPKNRTQQEIIEQRYAYFLHKKGVDQAYQHISSPPKKQEINDNIKSLNQKRLMQVKNVIDKISSNTELMRKEDDDIEQDRNDQSGLSSQSNISINQYIHPQEHHQFKRKSIFQPNNNNSNKKGSQKLQNFLHSSVESRKQSSTSIKLTQKGFNSYLKTEDNNQLSPKTQRTSISQFFTVNNINQEQYKEKDQDKSYQTIVQSNSQESVPIIKQVLARYGRVNNKEGESILNRIQSWRKEEDHQKVQNCQFFVTKMEEQKIKHEDRCVSIEKDEEKKKKMIILQILKRKFSSKQAQNLEKMYKQEKEWDSTIEDAQSLSQNISRVINTARSRINSLKHNDTSNPDIQKLYKKSTTQTGFIFIDKNGQRL